MSLVAVRVAGINAWSAFVGLLIVVQLLAQIIDWGSRDAVLRTVGADADGVQARWQTNFVSRFLPLLPVCLVVLAIVVLAGMRLSAGTLLAGAVWLTALAVSRAFDAMIVLRRAFGLALAVEVLATAVTVGGLLVLGPSRSIEGLTALFAGTAVFRVLLLQVLRAFAGLRGQAHFDRTELRRTWPFFAMTMSGAIGSRIDLYVLAAVLPLAAGPYQVLTGLLLLVQAASAAIVAPFVTAIYAMPRAAIRAASLKLLAVGLVLTPAAILVVWTLIERLYLIELPADVLFVGWLSTLPVFAYLPFIYGAYREGRERSVLVANVAGIVVGLAATLALAPRLGMLGAMLAALAAQSTVAAMVIASTVRAAEPVPAR